MVGPNPYKLYSFAELRHFGRIYLVCYGGCSRYALLSIEKHGDRDTRKTTFSCCVCGTAGHGTQENPHEAYREDTRANPRRHPKAVARLTGRPLRPSRAHQLREQQAHPPKEPP